MKQLHRQKWLMLAATVLALSACGGGSNDDGPGSGNHYTELVSFGDSLSDLGTYKVGSIAQLAAANGGAGRWTVNDMAGGQVWTEQLAATLGLPKPCPAETGLKPNVAGITGAAVKTFPGCRSYAQGSARVFNPLGPNAAALQAYGQTNLGLLAKPVQDQMAAHLAVAGGYKGSELVLVLAGANDVFMELETSAKTDPKQAVTNVALAGAVLATLVKTEVVARGARRVLVLSLPDVASTPFGKAQTTSVQGLIDTMVTQFNAQLSNGLKGVPEVIVADAYAFSKQQAANPASFGYTNTTGVACGPNALSNPPTANGTSLVCNAGNAVAGDVSGYMYADHVHPTPRAHQALAGFVKAQLQAAGWW